MERHGALRRVEYEQLAPAQSKQPDLIGHLEVWKERDVASPLHGAEQQPGGQLADILNPHDVVRCWLRRLHALGRPSAGRGAVAGGGVRLRSK